MRILGFARSAAMLAAGVFAGCGGSPPQGAVPPAGAPPGAALVRPPSHGVSWMGKGVKQQDLLYVSNGDGVVNVYRYWQHTLVGVLGNFTNPEGECTDAAGDVYIVDEKAEKIYKYAHGGTKAIKTIDDSPQAPFSCAVNQATGDLAIANYGENYYGAGNITIYPHGSGKPTIYKTGDNLDHFVSCNYDHRGDLFSTSDNGYGSFYSSYFYYLPKQGKSLKPMTLPGPSRSWQWGSGASIVWDGKYWVVGTNNEYTNYDLLRYIINVKAYYVSTTQLSVANNAQQIAIYRPIVKSHSAEVVGTNGAVYYWNYPAGGNPIGQITKGLDDPYGVAISLGTP
ncbi:MAG TPA: hypothetical protein VIW73_04735 [Candidatus Cybelea sp.]